MKDVLEKSIDEAVSCILQLKTPQALQFMDVTSKMMADAFKAGNKVLVAGNGGSLSDATHFAEELTGIFRNRRKALPALALSDPAHITCVGNDLGFHEVFSRGVEAFGKRGDVFIGLTTSGNSPNILAAFEAAKKQGLKTIAFLGKGGGKLKGVADHELLVDHYSASDRIQETHMTAMHMIIELIEHYMFS